MFPSFDLPQIFSSVLGHTNTSRPWLDAFRPKTTLTESERASRNFIASPACRLPNELLASIFKVNYISCFQPASSSFPSLHANTFEAQRHIDIMSQVCSRWRCAAFSDATLWSAISITYVGPIDEDEDEYESDQLYPCLEALELRLERSRLAPLTLEISHIPLLNFGILPNSGHKLIKARALISSNLARVRNLRICTRDILSALPLPSILASALHNLEIRVVNGAIPSAKEGLAIFETDPSLLYSLDMEFPLLTRTRVRMTSQSNPNSTKTHHTELKRLRLINIGDDSSPIALIAESASNLESVIWAQSMPLVPCLVQDYDNDDALSRIRLNLQHEFPVLNNLDLSGYVPFRFFGEIAALGLVDKGPVMMKSVGSDVVREQRGMSNLTRLRLAPKNFQRSRSAPTNPSPSLLPPSLPSFPQQDQPGASLRATAPLSGPAADLSDFLRRAYFPGLREFILEGSTAIQNVPDSPITPEYGLGGSDPGECALESFLRRHSATINFGNTS